MPPDVLPPCRQSTGTTSSKLSTTVSDRPPETVIHLPLDMVPEYPQHLAVNSPATWVVQQGTGHCRQGGDGTTMTTLMNPTAQQWTGCVSSTSSNSNLSPASPSSCQTSVTPMSQPLVSGTRSSSSSSSSSSGRGSMMFGPDDFIELFRSRVMSEARGENTLNVLQDLKHQRQRHRVCIADEVLFFVCRLF